MPSSQPVWLSMLLAAVADGMAVAAAFGAHLTQTQTVDLLAFVGSASAFIVFLVGLLHAHRLHQAVKLATATASKAG